MALRHLAASWSAVDRDRRFATVLLGGVVLLLCELRFEHREVLGETWRSWIPLIYAAVTLLGGLVALLRWDGKGRRVLGMLFGAGIAVGLLGFWFHTDGHLVTGLRNVLWPGASRSARMAASRWAASHRRWPRWRSAGSVSWACSSVPRRPRRDRQHRSDTMRLSSLSIRGPL